MIAWFKWLYALLIADVFLIGQIPIVGGINLFQVTAILMLLTYFSMEKKLLVDKWLILYGLFVFCFFISAVLTGYESGFFKFVRSQLIGCYTLYLATYVLIKRNISWNYLLYPLVIIGVVDTIATLCQANGIPVQNPLLNYFVIDVEQEELLSSNLNILGLSVSGLYANPVFNGHNLLVFCIASLFLLFKDDKRLQYLGIIASTIILVGLFFCQQRGAFFISIAIWMFMVYRYISRRLNSKFLTMLLFVVVLLFIASHIIGFLESSDSRLISDSDSGREMLLRESINYYIKHPLSGGYAACIHLLGRPSHNLLVSAFLAGGLVGGIVLLSLLWQLLILAIKNIRAESVISPISFLFLGLLADSMVHNSGFVEGDPSTFLAMALLVYTLTNYRNCI